MPLIQLSTSIKAPKEICFDLARDIDAHQLSTSKTKERAISGRTSGLCEEGDTITWQSTHFGIKQKLTARVTKMISPFYFEDEMIKGAFSSMKHKHSFKTIGEQTIMTDEFYYTSPLGFIGKIGDWLFLKHYMANFLKERNRMLKEMAEEKQLIIT